MSIFSFFVFFAEVVLPVAAALFISIFIIIVIEKGKVDKHFWLALIISLVFSCLSVVILLLSQKYDNEETQIKKIDVIQPQKILVYDGKIFVYNSSHFHMVKETGGLSNNLEGRFYKNNGLVFKEILVTIENDKVTLHQPQ